MLQFILSFGLLGGFVPTFCLFLLVGLLGTRDQTVVLAGKLVILFVNEQVVLFLIVVNVLADSFIDPLDSLWVALTVSVREALADPHVLLKFINLLPILGLIFDIPLCTSCNFALHFFVFFLHSLYFFFE